MIDGFNGGTGPFSIAAKNSPFLTSTEEYRPDKMQVFPNPADEFINIKAMNELNGAVRISLSDIYGKEVFSESFNNLFSEKINIKSQKAGIYFLTISNGSVRIEKKMIISHE